MHLTALSAAVDAERQAPKHCNAVPMQVCAGSREIGGDPHGRIALYPLEVPPRRFWSNGRLPFHYFFLEAATPRQAPNLKSSGRVRRIPGTIQDEHMCDMPISGQGSATSENRAWNRYQILEKVLEGCAAVQALSKWNRVNWAGSRKRPFPLVTDSVPTTPRFPLAPAGAGGRTSDT